MALKLLGGSSPGPIWQDESPFVGAFSALMSGMTAAEEKRWRRKIEKERLAMEKESRQALKEQREAQAEDRKFQTAERQRKAEEEAGLQRGIELFNRAEDPTQIGPTAGTFQKAQMGPGIASKLMFRDQNLTGPEIENIESRYDPAAHVKRQRESEAKAKAVRDAKRQEAADKSAAGVAEYGQKRRLDESLIRSRPLKTPPELTKALESLNQLKLQRVKIAGAKPPASAMGVTDPEVSAGWMQKWNNQKETALRTVDAEIAKAAKLVEALRGGLPANYSEETPSGPPIEPPGEYDEELAKIDAAL